MIPIPPKIAASFEGDEEGLSGWDWGMLFYPFAWPFVYGAEKLADPAKKTVEEVQRGIKQSVYNKPIKYMVLGAMVSGLAVYVAVKGKK